MKFLLDQGLARSAAALLSGRGHETVHVADVEAPDALDPAILSRAAADGRVVVTLDADFHAIIALSGATGPSVVRIRIEGLKGPTVCDLLVLVATRCAEDLAAGALVSVDVHGIRVRTLPIR